MKCLQPASPCHMIVNFSLCDLTRLSSLSPPCDPSPCTHRHVLLAFLPVTLARASAIYHVVKSYRQETTEGLIVEWNDGHKSEYSTKWLQDRAFTPTARALHKERYALRRVRTLHFQITKWSYFSKNINIFIPIYVDMNSLAKRRCGQHSWNTNVY